MTDCPNGEMRDLLPDLLHDRLSPARRAEVEAHVASCADCRDELELLAVMRGTLRAAPAVDVASIVAALPARQASVRRTWGGWRAAAAVAAIAVGGASLVIARHDTPVATPSVTVATTPVVRAPDTAPVIVAPPAPAPVQRVAQAPARRELAVAGTVADLSDEELTALLAGLESLDAMPSTSVDADAASLAPAAEVIPAKGAS